MKQAVNSLQELRAALSVLDLPPCPEQEQVRTKDGRLVAACDAWKIGYMQIAVRRALGFRDAPTH